ncbi:PBP1A family penicillin-binding protein [Fictibacillus sp. NE201]|uniref:PBP1A family penicillin-binding protein n=2 Tax=Fictibacillus fluitans TaxID=3058422 RepID=A0ABT8I1N2_9BACL|nr:PBP1A family penicillin-binding protein [Fictibacillus sp. NE201]MDN4526929.1 PBP1A family penicillin-binding protein [Fictibacillus sp. NE201]
MLGIGLLIGIFIAGFMGYLFILMAGDYVVDDKDLVMSSASKLVDMKGNTITRIYSENRELVSGKEIPDEVKDAFVAVEDTRFYEHHGLDFRSIARAIYRDIAAGHKVEGGSTITQQLTKNVFLSHEKSLLRKTKEAVIAINLERRYSKDKILEMYLNQIYFGHGAYGIQAASKFYFNKDVSELTLEEGAMLAGMPKAPSHYSPIEHREASKKRRDLVLDLMANQHFITAEQAVRAKGRTISLNLHKEERNPALTTYIDMVLKEATDRYHLSREEMRKGGYKVVVPMQKDTQNALYQTFLKPDYFVGTGNERPEGAMVLMDADTGGIIAAQGGRGYLTEGLNRVNVNRQPGSSFKPLAVYAPALETKAYKPYSMLKDEQLSYKGYKPKNYDGKYRGKVSMAEAIRDSINAPAVWLLNELGIDQSKAALKKLGMDIPDKGLGIALGGLDHGVSPYQMMAAYRSFARDGKTIKPYVIAKIYDRNGELVGKASHKEKKVFKKQTAWYMTRMLQQVVEKGTGKSGNAGTELAGKTGTTNYEGVPHANKDAWFVGYTPKVVGAAWIGYDRTTNESYLNTSSEKATLLFKDVISQMPSQRALTFKKPKGVKELDPPVDLIRISDLKASFALGSFGVPGIKLSWTPSDDERLQYKIYAIKDGESTHVDTVIGKGSYTVSGRYLFSMPKFYVVPLNPQTDQEGEPSNSVELDLFR